MCAAESSAAAPAVPLSGSHFSILGCGSRLASVCLCFGGGRKLDPVSLPLVARVGRRFVLLDYGTLLYQSRRSLSLFQPPL